MEQIIIQIVLGVILGTGLFFAGYNFGAGMAWRKATKHLSVLEKRIDEVRKSNDR